MIKICKQCGAEFKHYGARGGLFCSSACYLANPPQRHHGQSHSPTYVSWRDMKIRCLNPTKKDYPHYGGRGIKVCERWMTFANFFADMGEKPGREYTIERNDSDGDYEPSNCRWATKLEQARNKGNTYTAEQDQRIRDGIALGHNFKQIATGVGKSHSSVSMRAYRLGLRSGQPCRRVSP